MSKRGGQLAGKRAQSANSEVKLFYKPHVDLVNNAVEEGKAALLNARNMRSVKGQHHEANPVSALHCFALAMPRDFVSMLVQYTETVPDSKPISPFDMVGYLKAEVGIRSQNTSAKNFFGTEKVRRPKTSTRNTDLAEAYATVSAALRDADKPAADKVRGNQTPIPPSSFCQVTLKMINLLNDHWVSTYFVKGLTCVDLDDDKLHHGSSLWNDYGFSMHTTKDKKRRPVNNLIASIGGGFVLHVMPEIHTFTRAEPHSSNSTLGSSRYCSRCTSGARSSRSRERRC